MEALQRSLDHERYGFGLTEPEVRRLQEILRRRHHAELPLDEVWQRAIELLELGMVLLDSLPSKAVTRGA
jgi:hypothetical protein